MSDPFQLPPESVTPGQLFMLLQAMNARLATIAAEQVRQGQRLDKIEVDSADMLRAWNAGGQVLRFVKLVGSIAVACGAVWAFTRGLVPGGR